MGIQSPVSLVENKLVLQFYLEDHKRMSTKELQELMFVTLFCFQK